MNADEVLNLLKECHAMVWATRDRMANTKWTAPNTADSLRFAVTEAGEALKAQFLTMATIKATEAMDAMLREVGGFARNDNDKQHSVNAELADCAMMLLTAMGETFSIPPSYLKFPRTGLEEIIWCVSIAAYSFAATNCDTGIAWSNRGLIEILRYPDLDLRTELSARLERIERKHGQPWNKAKVVTGECHQ